MNTWLVRREHDDGDVLADRELSRGIDEVDPVGVIAAQTQAPARPAPAALWPPPIPRIY
jgi:hypothetical protein